MPLARTRLAPGSANLNPFYSSCISCFNDSKIKHPKVSTRVPTAVAASSWPGQRPHVQSTIRLGYKTLSRSLQVSLLATHPLRPTPHRPCCLKPLLLSSPRFSSSRFRRSTRRARGGISVSVSTASPEVASLADSVILTAEITNNNAEDIKILKYATILDGSLPTRSFVVTDSAGATVPFVGVKLSVSLDEPSNDAAFVTIPAGQTISVTHDVSALFDFASAGAGAFTFTPISTFQTAPAAEKITKRSELALVEVDAAAVTKRATNICTNASRASFITASYNEAKTLARTASSYVTSRGTADTLYRAYWGATAASRITSVFNAVANEAGSRTLSCTDSFGVCDGNVIAYTVISTTNIYYCSIFFNEVPSTSLCSGTTVASRNVRGGTTLHELTHATSGTDDVIYGCANDQALSDANAVRNADNYNCFSTQVYANTVC
ncbi:Neutral protease 2 [Mycena kentingensis (nom. inval.)]|nr:Neutral protease 2 [Mycena kentingensis (nom. inval.)]